MLKILKASELSSIFVNQNHLHEKACCFVVHTCIHYRFQFLHHLPWFCRWRLSDEQKPGWLQIDIINP